MKLRLLLGNVSRFLDDNDIQWWFSGGTLLGCIRNQSIPSHFDDDVDLHIKFTDKDKLLRCIHAVQDYDCRAIVPLAFGKYRATSAVRFVLRGAIFPVLDIFFVGKDSDMISKLDYWIPEPTYNSKERWSPQDIFPIYNNISVDGMLVSLPSDPLRVLNIQYGLECMTHIIARPLGMSHLIPSLMLAAVDSKNARVLPSAVEFLIFLYEIIAYRLV
jgi:hypothetical protein